MFTLYHLIFRFCSVLSDGQVFGSSFLIIISFFLRQNGYTGCFNWHRPSCNLWSVIDFEKSQFPGWTWVYCFIALLPTQKHSLFNWHSLLTFFAVTQTHTQIYAHERLRYQIEYKHFTFIIIRTSIC